MNRWSLDPDVVHLKHASFGAWPVSVLEAQQAWRTEMERNPVLFMMKRLQPALDQSRQALARFVGADPAGLVYVPNATAGVNGVVQSMQQHLGPGDEIVITDHTYNACRNIVELAANRTGAKLIEVAVPFPLDSTDRITEAVLERVTASTRLVMIDMVTSPTALIVPVQTLVDQLEPAIPVLVDAAHAPGMVPLDLEALGALYVVGNCHKWMCAPKGAGFLYVREDRRNEVLPATVSHGWNTPSPIGGSQFHNLFDWTGTDDPGARLSVPAAIGTMEAMHAAGWPGVMATNRVLVLKGRDIVCAALGVTPPAPEEAIGSMATIVLPRQPNKERIGGFDPLTEHLRDKWAIEVPVFAWRDWPHSLLRISAQLYNTRSDCERLAEALTAELDL